MEKQSSQAEIVLEELIAFWQYHKGFDANISGFAKYVGVSRDTAYRWLNRKCLPKENKVIKIKEWLADNARK